MISFLFIKRVLALFYGNLRSITGRDQSNACWILTLFQLKRRSSTFKIRAATKKNIRRLSSSLVSCSLVSSSLSCLQRCTLTSNNNMHTDAQFEVKEADKRDVVFSVVVIIPQEDKGSNHSACTMIACICTNHVKVTKIMT